MASGVTFDPAIHLTPMDVAINNPHNPSMLKIRLKASKTDQTRAGVELYVGRTHNGLCPVATMLRYLAVRGFDYGPLFQLEDGTPLSRPALVEKLRSALSRAGVDATHYAGHSFRIGVGRQPQQQQRGLVIQPFSYLGDGRVTVIHDTSGPLAISWQVSPKLWHGYSDYAPYVLAM